MTNKKYEKITSSTAERIFKKQLTGQEKKCLKKKSINNCEKICKVNWDKGIFSLYLATKIHKIEIF